MKALFELLKTLTGRRKKFRPKREGFYEVPLKDQLVFKKRKSTEQERHDFLVKWINRVRLTGDAGRRSN